MLKRERCTTAAIVLAAGESKRMPSHNKLLSPVDGVPMIVRVVQTIEDAGVSDIIVVTGHESANIHEALTDCDVRFVHNPEYKKGMSTSLRAGVAAIGERSNSTLICLGDMPWITTGSVQALLSAFDPDQPRICVPVYGLERGHPVLWPAGFFAELTGISGDCGARQLLDEYASEVTRVAVSDANVTLDVDTLDALDQHQRSPRVTREQFDRG
jgi:molybdenum cofactor cytidylyltransferase